MLITTCSPASGVSIESPGVYASVVTGSTLAAGSAVYWSVGKPDPAKTLDYVTSVLLRLADPPSGPPTTISAELYDDQLPTPSSSTVQGLAVGSYRIQIHYRFVDTSFTDHEISFDVA